MTTQPGGYRMAQCCGTCRHSWYTSVRPAKYYCGFGAMEPPKHGDAPTLEQWIAFRADAENWAAQRPQITHRNVCDFWESDTK